MKSKALRARGAWTFIVGELMWGGGEGGGG